MKAASALVSGQQPTPALVEQAVRKALEDAELATAGIVILFLTRDFARHVQPAILAAARAAGCLQVLGSTASGLLTEKGWLLDQPGAAALVIEGAGNTAIGTPAVSFCGHSTLPFDWQGDIPRAGLLDTDAAVWSRGRLAADGRSESRLPGFRSGLALSTGLHLLGEAQTVDRAHGFELQVIGGQPAVNSLRRSLPADLRESLPWHQIVALRQPDEPGLAILSANADGSLTLGEAPVVGERLHWAMRQPLAAERNMRQALSTLAPNDGQPFAPDFGLMFSCIGRGPLFYGNDDRDLLAFRERFPRTPLLGAYGSGQIAPVGGRNRLFHNAVVTLLFESTHV